MKRINVLFSMSARSLKMVALVLAFGASDLLSQPDWWVDYGLVDGSPRQDDAIATLGQAKHVIMKAHSYLEVELSEVGGAGPWLDSFLSSFCIQPPEDSGCDLVPLTVGQLKYLGKPFYDRLNSPFVGLDTRDMNRESLDIYPWTLDGTDDEDLALATLGQLKFVFSFDLSGLSLPHGFVDSDDDGLADVWEWRVIQSDLSDNVRSLSEVKPGDDFDADRISNLEEFFASTNPLSSFSADGDSIPDDWEVYYGLDVTPGVDSSGHDSDCDGASSLSEFEMNTDPTRRDHPDVCLILY
ncbi:hypothetical protein [Coraliomargarita parva]|uniref:hypothetical protein n=1 Tax=Coraliomargarita parva TaxID=3014050 RepID=UPI0022B2BA14|nr:hypothetical protein [Coraliomargarita parva]